MPFAKVHSVIIFAEPRTDKHKVSAYFYYTPKVFMARNKFSKEHPGRAVVRVIDLGVSEVEFDWKKYNELYEEA